MLKVIQLILNFLSEIPSDNYRVRNRLVLRIENILKKYPENAQYHVNTLSLIIRKEQKLKLKITQYKLLSMLALILLLLTMNVLKIYKHNNLKDISNQELISELSRPGRDIKLKLHPDTVKIKAKYKGIPFAEIENLYNHDFIQIASGIKENQTWEISLKHNPLIKDEIRMLINHGELSAIPVSSSYINHHLNFVGLSNVYFKLTEYSRRVVNTDTLIAVGFSLGEKDRDIIWNKVDMEMFINCNDFNQKKEIHFNEYLITHPAWECMYILRVNIYSNFDSDEMLLIPTVNSITIHTAT